MDKVQNAQKTAAAGSSICFSSELDRVYSAPSTQSVKIEEDGRARIEIIRDELGEIVVWNPWQDKAGSMADLGPVDAWKRFVCVEPGSVAGWNSLEPGDSWEGGQRMRFC